MPELVKYCKRRGRLPSIEVVDLFCGIGGLSYGMMTKGFKILAGVDLDDTCKYAYETNNKAKFLLLLQNFFLAFLYLAFQNLHL